MRLFFVAAFLAGLTISNPALPQGARSPAPIPQPSGIEILQDGTLYFARIECAPHTEQSMIEQAIAGRAIDVEGTTKPIETYMEALEVSFLDDNGSLSSILSPTTIGSRVSSKPVGTGNEARLALVDSEGNEIRSTVAPLFLHNVNDGSQPIDLRPTLCDKGFFFKASSDHIPHVAVQVIAVAPDTAFDFSELYSAFTGLATVLGDFLLGVDLAERLPDADEVEGTEDAFNTLYALFDDERVYYDSFRLGFGVNRISTPITNYSIEVMSADRAVRDTATTRRARDNAFLTGPVPFSDYGWQLFAKSAGTEYEAFAQLIDEADLGELATDDTQEREEAARKACFDFADKLRDLGLQPLDIAYVLSAGAAVSNPRANAADLLSCVGARFYICHQFDFNYSSGSISTFVPNALRLDPNLRTAACDGVTDPDLGSGQAGLIAAEQAELLNSQRASSFDARKIEFEAEADDMSIVSFLGSFVAFAGESSTSDKDAIVTGVAAEFGSESFYVVFANGLRAALREKLKQVEEHQAALGDGLSWRYVVQRRGFGAEFSLAEIFSVLDAAGYDTAGCSVSFDRGYFMATEQNNNVQAALGINPADRDDANWWHASFLLLDREDEKDGKIPISEVIAVQVRWPAIGERDDPQPTQIVLTPHLLTGGPVSWTFEAASASAQGCRRINPDN